MPEAEYLNNRPIEETLDAIVSEIKEEYLSEKQNYPWIIGFSGGKDSTVVAHAIFQALMDIPPYKRTRPVHVVSNDTLVESPLVIAHLDEVSGKIDEAARKLGLPVSVVRTVPEINKSFWVLLIGKGYPSPNMSMRWCTDRLKIQPTSGYIKSQVSQSGAAIVVLGVRKKESQARQRAIEKRQNLRGERLSSHQSLAGAFVYRPIVDLDLFDVWEILGTFHAPWGGTHQNLIQLYRDSEGGECPVVLSADEAPGCGTPNSRFGCWTCTVVEKDKSLQGVIDTGKHQYLPLVEFRNWLKSIRNDPNLRQAIRRNGKLTFSNSGNHIPGPFTIKARKDILSRLLEVQEAFGEQLVSEQEISLIHRHWAEELGAQKGTGDE